MSRCAGSSTCRGLGMICKACFYHKDFARNYGRNQNWSGGIPNIDKAYVRAMQGDVPPKYCHTYDTKVPPLKGSWNFHCDMGNPFPSI